MKACIWSILIILSVWASGFNDTLESWAGNGSVPTTTGLDLDTVRFQVISPPELEDHLYNRALNHFAKAGISWNSPRSSTKKKAVLQLMLKPDPMAKVCPGKFLYEPMLVLRDKVIVSRNGGKDIENQTWSSQAPPHIIPARTSKEFDSDLDEFIQKFIVNYQLGQAAYSEFAPDPQVPLSGHVKDMALSTKIPEEHETNAHEGLERLNLSKVKFSGWAGRYTNQIDSRARKQLERANLQFISNPDSHTSRTLRLSLSSWPAREECPNKVLYEASLVLTERAQIKRNPKLYVWSDTWSRRKLTVLDAVSLEQLKADQEDLIADFILSYRTANPDKTP